MLHTYIFLGKVCLSRRAAYIGADLKSESDLPTALGNHDRESERQGFACSCRSSYPLSH